MHFPENKISGYTTKLPLKVVLEGDWECGLAEVHYPLTFYNVVNDEFAIRKSVPEPSTQKQLPQLTIPNGHYGKGNIMDSVNKFIADTNTKITINKHTRKATVPMGRVTRCFS